MQSWDSLLVLFLYGQPVFLGLALLGAIRRGLATGILWSSVNGARAHRKGVRFFECAVRPRQQATFAYELPLLTFCALFILYDADLIFFLPELVSGELWTLSQFYLVAVCGLFFLGSLWYDMRRCGFLWDV
jgi:NADH:ubiquinone oxidoreductase subunit 3 (subunit A)